ncbi:MAG: hypothetical protein ABJK43_08795 [Lentilitoribacter sp.]
MRKISFFITILYSFIWTFQAHASWQNTWRSERKLEAFFSEGAVLYNCPLPSNGTAHGTGQCLWKRYFPDSSSVYRHTPENFKILFLALRKEIRKARREKRQQERAERRAQAQKKRTKHKARAGEKRAELRAKLKTNQTNATSRQSANSGQKNLTKKARSHLKKYDGKEDKNSLPQLAIYREERLSGLRELKPITRNSPLWKSHVEYAGSPNLPAHLAFSDEDMKSLRCIKVNSLESVACLNSAWNNRERIKPAELREKVEAAYQFRIIQITAVSGLHPEETKLTTFRPCLEDRYYGRFETLSGLGDQLWKCFARIVFHSGAIAQARGLEYRANVIKGIRDWDILKSKRRTSKQFKSDLSITELEFEKKYRKALADFNLPFDPAQRYQQYCYQNSSTAKRQHFARHQHNNFRSCIIGRYINLRNLQRYKIPPQFILRVHNKQVPQTKKRIDNRNKNAERFWKLARVLGCAPTQGERCVLNKLGHLDTFGAPRGQALLKLLERKAGPLLRKQEIEEARLRKITKSKSNYEIKKGMIGEFEHAESVSLKAFFKQTGIKFYMRKPGDLKIISVTNKSPAERGGIKAGDGFFFIKRDQFSSSEMFASFVLKELQQNGRVELDIDNFSGGRRKVPLILSQDGQVYFDVNVFALNNRNGELRIIFDGITSRLNKNKARELFYSYINVQSRYARSTNSRCITPPTSRSIRWTIPATETRNGLGTIIGYTPASSGIYPLSMKPVMAELFDKHIDFIHLPLIPMEQGFKWFSDDIRWLIENFGCDNRDIKKIERVLIKHLSK